MFRELKRIGGGMVVVKNRKVLSSLELPLAGLMSDRPAGDIAGDLEKLRKSAKSLGCREDALCDLSAMTLSVIPELRITDRGLVDVEKFQLVPVVVKA